MLAAAGWMLLGVVLLAGAGKTGELRAKRLVIEDDQGRERIVLDVRDGVPRIVIKDASGDQRFSAWVVDDLSCVDLSYYRDGFRAGEPTRHLMLMAGKTTAPRVDIWDGEAKTKSEKHRMIPLP